MHSARTMRGEAIVGGGRPNTRNDYRERERESQNLGTGTMSLVKSVWPPADSGQAAILGDFKSRVFAVGPQIGFIFPVGEMQGYLNLKAYKEFAAENRPEGWNGWLTLAVSPAAAPPPLQSTLVHK
jgi:hypothetical protein